MLKTEQAIEGNFNREIVETENRIRKIEEELQLELKNKEEELKQRVEELEKVRCQNAVILARLEDLEELDRNMRIVATKKDFELQGYNDKKKEIESRFKDKSQDFNKKLQDAKKFKEKIKEIENDAWVLRSMIKNKNAKLKKEKEKLINRSSIIIILRWVQIAGNSVLTL